MSIDALVAIESEQWWQIEEDKIVRRDTYPYCCGLIEALEFAHVMEVALDLFQEEADEQKIELAKDNLYDRYVSLIENQSIVAKSLLTLFLWILGYSKENSIEVMASNLKYFLHIENKEIKDDELEIEIKKYPNLTTLNLCNCWKLTSNSFKSLKTHYPQLKRLILRGCDELEDEAFITLAESCPQLIELNLGSCVEITDRGLKAIAVMCSSLKDITLEKCKKITDDGVKIIISNCPNLENIDLTDCEFVSPDCLKFLETEYPDLRINY